MFTWVGFGSCHSFGVAVGLRGYGMCQMRGGFRRGIFLKMRRVGCIIFLVCPRLIFQSPSYLRSRSLVHVGNFCLKIVFRCFLKHKFVRALLLPTFVFLQWCLYEAASCPRGETLNEDKTLNQLVTAPLQKHQGNRF